VIGGWLVFTVWMSGCIIIEWGKSYTLCCVGSWFWRYSKGEYRRGYTQVGGCLLDLWYIAVFRAWRHFLTLL